MDSPFWKSPKKEGGIAFLNATIVAAGDIASVKGAIDRSKTPQPLPAAVIVKVNQWSNSQDAWGITTVPPVQPGARGRSQGCCPEPDDERRAERAIGGGWCKIRRAGGV